MDIDSTHAILSENTVLASISKVWRQGGTSTKILLLSFAVISILFIGSFIFLALLRVRYPYEVEWLEGAFMDHILRVRHGLPIYTTPSINYIPYLYTPLYYYVASISMAVFGEGFFAARVLTLSCTLLSATLIFFLVHRNTSGSLLLSGIGVSIFLASYGFGGYYYDLVRMDMLLVLLLLLAVASATQFTGWTSSILSAIFLVLAFYTKQQALFAFPALTLWLFLRRRGDALQFGVVSALLFATIFFYLQHSSEGWFYYYAFKVTRQVGKNFRWLRAMETVPQLLIRYWSPVLFLLILHVSSYRRKMRAVIGTPIGLFAMTFFALLISGMVSLGNEMGYVNLLIPFAAFASVLLPILLSQLMMQKTLSVNAGLAIAIVQLLGLYYNPTSEKMVIASKRQEAGGKEFLTALRAIPGEVYMPDHCYLPTLAGKSSHSHITSYFNIMEMRDSVSRNLQKDFDSAFASKRFSAIILDDHGDARRDSTDGYVYARKIFTTPNIFLSRWGSGATRPDFIYLP